MILADASTFIGRFHPLLVHLPIGFLLLSAILALVGRREKYQAIQPAISFALLAGTVCAFFACVTGIILSSTGDYNHDTLFTHMIGGFITTIVSLFAYLVSSGIISTKYFQTSKVLLVTLLLMVITISITGHLGGTLTHGSGYISSDILFSKQKEKKQITDINEALIYEDIIQPILEKKCSGCHNASKKKGELSMESYKTLIKGGKHGLVIEAGHSEKSELIRRVALSPKDDKFMPADNKPALSEQERNIIIWWIDKNAAAVGKKVKNAGSVESVKKDIIAYLGLQNEPDDDTDSDSSNNYFAHLNVPHVSEQQVGILKQSGFIIKYINLRPVLLDVTLPENKTASTDSINNKLKSLLIVKDNIVWLNLADNNISDNQLQLIGTLKNLQRLRLDNNAVTDAGVGYLKNLINLESINLYNTKVSAQSVAALSSLLKLKHVYVWGTSVAKKDSSLKVVTGVN